VRRKAVSSADVVAEKRDQIGQTFAWKMIEVGAQNRVWRAAY
jgi:hypothetical protein